MTPEERLAMEVAWRLGARLECVVRKQKGIDPWGEVSAFEEWHDRPVGTYFNDMWAIYDFRTI